MSSKKHIEQEVDKTLHSLDELKPAKADDFFYSRLTARLEHREQEQTMEGSAANRKDLGFTFSIAAVFMLMILNLAFISLYPDSPEDGLDRTEAVEELASEYSVPAIDLNYYEFSEGE